MKFTGRVAKGLILIQSKEISIKQTELQNTETPKAQNQTIL